MLIALVKQHPCLYDRNVPEHRDIGKCTEAWIQIAIQMKVEALEAKKRWRGLRDTYVRKKRMVTVGKHTRSGLKASQWKYMKPMRFLDEQLGESESGSNKSVDDDEDDDIAASANDGPVVKSELVDEYLESLHMTAEDVNDDDQPQYDDEDEDESYVYRPRKADTSLQPTSTTRRRSLRPRSSLKKRVASSSFDDTSPVNKSSRLSVDNMDDDELFMASYLVQMKRLTAQQKGSVKCQIAQLFHRVQYPIEAPPRDTPELRDEKTVSDMEEPYDGIIQCNFGLSKDTSTQLPRSVSPSEPT